MYASGQGDIHYKVVFIQKPIKQVGGTSSLKSERREFQAEDLPCASTLRKEGAWPMWGAAKGRTAEQKGQGGGHGQETEWEEQRTRRMGLMD